MPSARGAGTIYDDDKLWNSRGRTGRACSQSLTTDNGGHATIGEKPHTTVYFADSYASWQKGAIENTNKLIRQYIPKGTDFRELTDEFITSVQYKLNSGPRKKLNFSTPKDEFFKLL